MKLKKVQEQEFNPLPTEFQLTPFEMLMQDIRARNYKLRKVMVSRPGAAPPPPVCWPPPGDPWERADVAPIPSVTGADAEATGWPSGIPCGRCRCHPKNFKCAGSSRSRDDPGRWCHGPRFPMKNPRRREVWVVQDPGPH